MCNERLPQVKSCAVSTQLSHGQGHGPRIIGGDVLTLKIQADIENEGLLVRAKSLLGHIASDLT